MGSDCCCSCSAGFRSGGAGDGDVCCAGSCTAVLSCGGDTAVAGAGAGLSGGDGSTLCGARSLSMRCSSIRSATAVGSTGGGGGVGAGGGGGGDKAAAGGSGCTTGAGVRAPAQEAAAPAEVAVEWRLLQRRLRSRREQRVGRELLFGDSSDLAPHGQPLDQCGHMTTDGDHALDTSPLARVVVGESWDAHR